MGARPLRAATKLKEAILNTAQQGMKDETKPFTAAMVVKLEAKLNELTEYTPTTIATVIKQSTGMTKSVPNLAQKLVENAGRSDFKEIAPVKDHQYEFRDGLKFVVQHDLIKNQIVTVDQDGRDVVIRIKQSQITRKDRVGRVE